LNFVTSALLLTFFAIVCLYFVYLLILLVFGSFRKNKNLNFNRTGDSKRVSMIIATYNEENVIRRKIESLLSVTYPRDSYEIIVVDSGSLDNTRAIVSEYTQKGVILLEQKERLGKASALNFALSRAKGEIIILSDANSEFSPDSIPALVDKFDSETGAVLPTFLPNGRLSLWNRAFYWLHHTYKALESRADSVFVVFGELFAFRKDLISSIDERTAADDLEIAVTIRKKNFKVKYAPNVVVKEKLPTNRREIKTQTVRHTLGILQVMTKNINLLFNPKYGFYSLLIFPTHFLQLTIGPFLFFLAIGLLCFKIVEFALIFMNPLYLIVLLTIAAVLFSFLYFQSEKAKQIASFFYYFFAFQVYVIIAVVSLIKKRDDHIWAKMSSNR